MKKKTFFIQFANEENPTKQQQQKILLILNLQTTHI